jgi:hypothetical protein
LVTQASQPETSLAPVEHSLCEQVPPVEPLLEDDDELLDVVPLDEVELLLEEELVDPPEAMLWPLGVPSPVGPS